MSRELNRAKKLRNPSCSLCPLHEGASTVCVGPDGFYRLQVVVLGEAPGFQEDKMGKPFLGRAGKLLRSEMLRAGILPNKVYLTNTVKCFPHGTPTKEQIDICSSAYLADELSILKPNFILALGNSALRGVTRQTKITEARGKIHECTKGEALVFATFHPAYILRNKRDLETFRGDLELFATIIKL